jgi:hypothetical protein
MKTLSAIFLCLFWLAGCGAVNVPRPIDPDVEWFTKPHYFQWDGNAWRPVVCNVVVMDDAKECE